MKPSQEQNAALAIALVIALAIALVIALGIASGPVGPLLSPKAVNRRAPRPLIAASFPRYLHPSECLSGAVAALCGLGPACPGLLATPGSPEQALDIH
jgi:hypothetical protein